MRNIKKKQCKRYKTHGYSMNIKSANLKPFHEPLAHRPHTSSFAVQVHGDRHEHEEELYATNRQEHSA